MMKRIRVDDGRPAGTPTMGGEPKINTVDGDAPALVVEDDEHYVVAPWVVLCLARSMDVFAQAGERELLFLHGFLQRW